MKYTFFIALVFVSIVSKAQVVNVPNAQLMEEFREYGIDVNNDGILTVAEAETHKKVIVKNYGIDDFTGIEAFKNLEYLDCSNNSLTKLDLTKNTKLKYLNCNGNKLTQLNLSNNPLIDTLYCKFNSLTSINTSNLTQLKALDITLTKITSIDLSSNTKLLYFNNSGCGMSTLNLSNNRELIEFSGFLNNLSTIDLSNNTQLKKIVLNNNKLTEIKPSSKDSLHFFDCSNNQLTTLDVSAFNHLEYLIAQNNPPLSQICVKDTNLAIQKGYSKDSNVQWVENCATGISKNEVYSVDNSFFPNPTTGTIELGKNIIEASIFDINGKKISTNNSTLISLKNLKPGVYTIHLKNKTGKISSQKFVLE